MLAPDSLNPRQVAAVEHGEGPLLVLAGAGTGKTSALTARMAALLRRGDARPWEILAVTFTNKAANEMRERVRVALGEHAPTPQWMGTFHSISARLLRRHAEAIGLRPDFAILDSSDSQRLIRRLADARGIDTKRWPPRALAGVIDRWKNRGHAPGDLPAADLKKPDFKAISGLYEEYASELRKLNAADFGDLILHMVRVLKRDPELAAQYHERFRYVLVDEYQDTNVSQYLWLRLITGPHHNICCVGDDDQAIYGWRGAEVGHILRFERDFPGASVIRLEQNYRSTRHILAVGAELIAPNAARLGKTLWTPLKTGEKVRVGQFPDGGVEAQWIAEEIAGLIGPRLRRGNGVPANQIAILVRAAYLMRELEENLTFAGVPYRVVGGTRFYDRQEIRDATAYLELAAVPEAFIAFERVANTPRRGLGKVSVDRVRFIGLNRGLDVVGAARAAVAERAIRQPAAGRLEKLADMIDAWRRAHDAGARPHDLLEQILEETGYLDMWANDPAPESESRIQNLKEFEANLHEYELVHDALEHIKLVTDREDPEAAERVSLMTIHAAKGLEFEAVYLPCWEAEVFPSPRALEDHRNRGDEEERRLAHVAVTRAKRRLAISYASRRGAFGTYQYRSPSPYLADLPGTECDWIEDSGPEHDAAFDGASRLEVRAAARDQYASPGWRRMSANRAIATDGIASTRREEEGPNFGIGARVFHEKFGYGQVLGLDRARAEVQFPTGVKTVVARFLKPADRS